VRAEATEHAQRLAAEGITPGLAVVLVGDDPASAIYVRSKSRAAAKVGVAVFDHKLPASTSQADLIALVHQLNGDERVDGILVQLPVPDHIDSEAVLDAVSPWKDVDGLHAENLGLLAQNRPRFTSCTPAGCMRLIAESGMDPSGKSAVVIGRSVMVGKPLAMLLTNANATVTLCHSRTPNIAELVSKADIVCAAVGRAEMVKGDWIKPGAVVIDIGITRGDDNKLLGDVDYDAAAEQAGHITPVPGGVGPMTIAMLMVNTVRSASIRSQRS
jgi:methylenetetrahydrofolate dehydrogenase (NADP+)/methenyltetrahydrofolate cyclohydrolase